MNVDHFIRRGIQSNEAIKRRTMRLAPPFDELAVWIGGTWAVTVLNVIYDPRDDRHPPRLQVILEHQEDAYSFYDGYNFDQEKQQAITSRFLDMVNRQATHEYDARWGHPSSLRQPRVVDYPLGLRPYLQR